MDLVTKEEIEAMSRLPIKRRAIFDPQADRALVDRIEAEQKKAVAAETSGPFSSNDRREMIGKGYVYPREKTCVSAGKNMCARRNMYVYWREESMHACENGLCVPAGRIYVYPREQICVSVGKDMCTRGNRYVYPREQICVPAGTDMCTRGNRYPRKYLNIK